MTAALDRTRAADRFSIGRLLLIGVAAAAVAAIANLAVFVIAKELFDVSFVMPYQGPDTTPEPLPPALVAISSVVPAILAALLLWILGRTVGRPLLIFQVASVVALLLSLGGPPTPEDTATSTKVALIVMHVVAGVIIIGLLAW